MLAASRCCWAAAAKVWAQHSGARVCLVAQPAGWRPVVWSLAWLAGNQLERAAAAQHHAAVAEHQLLCCAINSFSCVGKGVTVAGAAARLDARHPVSDGCVVAYANPLAGGLPHGLGPRPTAGHAGSLLQTTPACLHGQCMLGARAHAGCVGCRCQGVCVQTAA